MLGVWMWPESLTKRGAAATFDACARAGVTDVFFLSKGLSGTAAFASSLVPPMVPGRDLMREALDAAHERGMKLHAWFTSASDARYKAAHPESGLYHYKNGRDRGVVSIADAGYLRFMREALADFLTRYDPDGVHLDYIRYNHLICGWSQEDQARYAEGGVSIPHIRQLMEKTFLGDSPDGEAIFQAYRRGDQDALALADARRRDVARFAEGLCEAVRAAKPEALLSAALMPEGAYDDLAFANLHYGQNYDDLAGLVDAFLPMAYSKAYDKDAAWVGDVTRGSLRPGVQVITGLHAYEGATALTLRQDWEAALAVPGASGVCLFREGAFVYAFAAGKALELVNPLPEALIACRIAGKAGEEFVETRVEPGESRTLRLSFEPDAVRVYTEKGEACALLTREG